MATPLPPHRVVSLNVPFKVLVVRADSNWEQEKRNEIEFEFTDRVFTANRALRGAYNPIFDNP